MNLKLAKRKLISYLVEQMLKDGLGTAVTTSKDFTRQEKVQPCRSTKVSER